MTESFLITEFVKSLIGIVAGLAEGFLKDRFVKNKDVLRFSAYRIVGAVNEIDSCINNLTKYTRRRPKSERDYDEVEAIILRTISATEELEKYAGRIELQYSVYKDIHDVIMIKTLQKSEMTLVANLYWTGQGGDSKEKIKSMLEELQSTCVELRSRISSFIKENYDLSEGPDGWRS